MIEKYNILKTEVESIKARFATIAVVSFSPNGSRMMPIITTSKMKALVRQFGVCSIVE